MYKTVLSVLTRSRQHEKNNKNITQRTCNYISYRAVYSILDFYYRLGGDRIGGTMARRKKYDYTPIPQRKTVKVKEDLTADVYRGSYSVDELQRMRRALAKRANQRIVRLERGESKVTGEKWNIFGAVTEVYDYLNRQKEGRTRFRETAKALTDSQALKREITVLQGFLGRKSSLVSGMKEIEEKRISSFESGKWGTKWKKTGIPNKPLHFTSNKEFYDFLNSETFNGLVSAGFTSEQLVELYDSARVRLGEEAEADAVSNAMADALEEYRNKGNASLKDLRKKMNAIKIKGSGNK